MPSHEAEHEEREPIKFPEIKLNAEQRLYIIPSAGGGYSCHGFDVVERDMRQLSEILDQPWRPECDTPSLSTYEWYRCLLQFYGDSPHSKKTWWNPGTTATVKRHLERLRGSDELARIWTGDPETGEPWLEEYDTLGTIGRTGGWLKSMILVPPGEIGGTIIFTDKVLRIDVWTPDDRKWTELWQAKNFQLPALDLKRGELEELPWEVWVGDKVHARFETLPKAAAWISWMSGEFYEPELRDSEEEDADGED
jgi:hypothetical protein